MLPFQRQPIAAALTLMLLSGAIPAVAEEDAVTRGEYLVHAGGCFSCHTIAMGEKLSGRRALDTPFGTFYSPNITPDPETGIGRWTDAQFLRASTPSSPAQDLVRRSPAGACMKPATAHSSPPLRAIPAFCG